MEVKIASPLDARLALARLDIAQKTVAALAGMDASVFSRTVHGKLRFSERRRIRIEAAIQQAAELSEAERAAKPIPRVRRL